LGAIKKERVRKYIGVDALSCILDEPTKIDRLMTTFDEQLDAYTYIVSDDEALVVHVYTSEEESFVVRSMAASDAAYELRASTTNGDQKCRGIGCPWTEGCDGVISAGPSFPGCAYGPERVLAPMSLSEFRSRSGYLP
jgi:hypothetical protein